MNYVMVSIFIRLRIKHVMFECLPKFKSYPQFQTNQFAILRYSHNNLLSHLLDAVTCFKKDKDGFLLCFSWVSIFSFFSFPIHLSFVTINIINSINLIQTKTKINLIILFCFSYGQWGIFVMRIILIAFRLTQDRSLILKMIYDQTRQLTC